MEALRVPFLKNSDRHHSDVSSGSQFITKRRGLFKAKCKKQTDSQRITLDCDA